MADFQTQLEDILLNAIEEFDHPSQVIDQIVQLIDEEIIGELSQDPSFHSDYVDGWNECNRQQREALGLEEESQR